MKEDKVREAIKKLDGYIYTSSPKHVMLGEVAELLKEAIAPEQPEIPEGCPVLVWNFDKDKDCSEAFYYKGVEDLYQHVEIDYQSKGHVIPWSGGECPVDDDTRVTTYHRDSDIGSCKAGMYTSWIHKDHEADIIAYVIWPTYLTEG